MSAFDRALWYAGAHVFSKIFYKCKICCSKYIFSKVVYIGSISKDDVYINKNLNISMKYCQMENEVCLCI